VGALARHGGRGMTVDGKTLATTEVALTVTTLDPLALDQHLMALPPERVAEFAIRAAAIARIAAQAKTVAYARLVQMGSEGDLFRDPVDDKIYRFTGGRHRVLKNVDGFVTQLAADGIDARPLLPWLSSNAFKIGDQIEGDQRIKDAVKEFATWVDDPLSLVELDPKTMRAVRR